MNFHNHALVLEVISQLRANGSWTGKTHVQKAFFLLQSCKTNFSGVDFSESEIDSQNSPFEFVLYRHGPYSFALEHAIEEMNGYKAIMIEPMNGYGVALWISNNASFVKRKAPLSEIEEFKIKSICQFIGDSDVKILERWATATWIRQREGIGDSLCVAKRLNEIKPHISVEDALLADKEVTPLFKVKLENSL